MHLEWTGAGFDCELREALGADWPVRGRTGVVVLGGADPAPFAASTTIVRPPRLRSLKALASAINE